MDEELAPDELRKLQEQQSQRLAAEELIRIENAAVEHENRKVQDIQRLKMLVEQVTHGCGRFMCDNKRCKSSGFIKENLSEQTYVSFAIKSLKSNEKGCSPIIPNIPGPHEIKRSEVDRLVEEYKKNLNPTNIIKYVRKTLYSKEKLLCQLVDYRVARRLAEIMIVEEEKIQLLTKQYFDFNENKGGKNIIADKHVNSMNRFSVPTYKERLATLYKYLRYPGEDPKTKKKLEKEKSAFSRDLLKQIPAREADEEEVHYCIKTINEISKTDPKIRRACITSFSKMTRSLVELFFLSNSFKANITGSFIFLKFLLNSSHVVSDTEFLAMTLVENSKVFSIVGPTIRNKLGKWVGINKSSAWITNYIEDIQQAITTRALTIRAYTETLGHDFFEGEDLPGLLAMLEVFHTAVLVHKRKHVDGSMVVKFENPYIKVALKKKNKLQKQSSTDQPLNVTTTTDAAALNETFKEFEPKFNNTEEKAANDAASASSSQAPAPAEPTTVPKKLEAGWACNLDEKIIEILYHMENTNNSRINVWNTSVDTSVPLTAFINDELSSYIEVDKEFDVFKNGFSISLISSFPFAFQTDKKHSFIVEYNKWRQSKEGRTDRNTSHQDDEDIHEHLDIRVRRDHVVNDALNWLSNIFQGGKQFNVRKRLRVQFEGEDGVDEGGLSKEFFQILNHNLFDPKFGMFTPTKSNSNLWFNPECTYCDQEYVLIGLMVGLALYNHVMIDVSLPNMLYKKLLSTQLDLEDLKELDNTMYNSMNELLNTSDAENIFFLNFTASYQDVTGMAHTHELITNGKNVCVTDANKKEYVRLYVNYLLIEQVQYQYEKFASGFFMVANPILLRTLCRPAEIDMLLCGVVDLDMKALEQNVDYQNGYDANSQTVMDFWKVVHEFDTKQKQQLLEFITGSHRIPIGGFKSLNFVIQRHGDTKTFLPSSHTCYNFFLLPDYKDYDVLKERLTLALNHSKGFGLQ
uniref:HECT domain-containing protein n=1 Tax=Rhabditophanes sp. KR3021 TaxID=114890 RepID=A0AC35UAX6_9BILA